MNFTKLKNQTLTHRLRAVSPVVATLILIIVAIIGAIAVGLIVSSVGNNTAGQANLNANKAANGGTTQSISIGGSTTLFPLDEAAIPTFQNTYNINVVDSQGGSDAGMQGVISGALDIGAASSVNAVHNAFTDVANNQIVGVTINYKLIGGSGVVVGTTSTANGQAQTGVNLLTTGFLTDGTNPCHEITRDALAKMFVLGQFSIVAGSCAAPGILAMAGVVAGTGTADYQTVSRSDAGGTEDAFGAYITGDTAAGGPTYTSGSGVLGNSANVGSGNGGLLSSVQKCSFQSTVTPANKVAGCIGFFDLGFAEGAVSGVTCATVGGTACISIPQLSSPADSLNTPDTPQAQTTTATNQYILAGQSTSGLHAFIKLALKAEANVNPVTLTGATSVYPDTAAPVNSLARTFYYVTNGTPNATEQLWINFMTSYNAETYFTQNAYFSQYDFTAA